VAVLTRDHKPDDELEKQRIQLAGGKIYRTQTFAKPGNGPGEKDIYVQGPIRVFPGRLSVSKTFGDIEAKRVRFGGNPNVVTAEPEIRVIKIQDNFDFLMIGCDGIFDRLSNKEVIGTIWESTIDLMQQSSLQKGGKHTRMQSIPIENR
jgi:protein phosphatase 2C family protein 2/3